MSPLPDQSKQSKQLDTLDYKRNYSAEEKTVEQREGVTDFVSQMVEYWDENVGKIFRRQKDIMVADSVIELFRRRDSIENFNKKALYILIREMTGSNTQHITRIINVMKKYNKRLQHEFDKYGMVDVSHTGSLVNE